MNMNFDMTYSSLLNTENYLLINDREDIYFFDREQAEVKLCLQKVTTLVVADRYDREKIYSRDA